MTTFDLFGPHRLCEAAAIKPTDPNSTGPIRLRDYSTWRWGKCDRPAVILVGLTKETAVPLCRECAGNLGAELAEAIDNLPVMDRLDAD